ncbi:MAG TPA: C4-type zinc ribbon domain-containing protein [Verrucomicrobiae bacterium]|nr:C4-type zinc ribbon domain-containing protein [Verrucomicrobiae bacterium]
MNKTLAMMLRLQELTLRARRSGGPAGVEKDILRLRGAIPEEYLSRFDRLLQRRRVAVAGISQSGACGACHLQLPVGDIWLVREASEILASCPHCGCFLYDPQRKTGGAEVIA